MITQRLEELLEVYGALGSDVVTESLRYRILAEIERELFPALEGSLA